MFLLLFFGKVSHSGFYYCCSADGLARKLDIEKSLPVGSLNDELQNRRVYIEKLDALKIEPGDDVPFKYMSAPSEPLTRDAPRRTLMVLLFALVGMAIGCGLVLMKSVMASRAVK
ncbi:hypothetical protein [Erwinia sp. S38]|uniref:hypothetical protein n=1 Tax=Erwinia sp. S38 TaxID=2769338 RepID=UPI00190E116B|nr:hypothetical protein [Erwinia sp. S38]MBK0002445.1 hypothetical protein [Erwinia sp. S38]